MIERILPAAVISVERLGEPKSRECAKEALEKLGCTSTSVPGGAQGEPLWPEGVVGSITHSQEYCAVAVAWARDIARLGIDAEVHRALREGVLDIIANDDELKMIRQLPAGVHWDAVLFSAKESVYKAWFPSGGHLGWEDVSIVIDPGSGMFTTLRPFGLKGRFLITENLVLTVAA